MPKPVEGHIETPAVAGRAIVNPAGIAAGTPVLTLDGEMPVEFLSPGDRIITRSGARVLRAVHLRVLTDAPACRIRASSLGHDRPETDLFVAPDQGLVIRDWRAKALYGRPVAVIPARRLADGEYLSVVQAKDLRLFTLDFGSDEIVYAGGLELACLTQATA